jgi:hypothetical protein
MFNALLKPKWQHSDPLQRKAALESDKVPPDVLASMARRDTDPDVRNSAIQRLGDLDLLTELLQSELTNQERDVVFQRQCELLARPLDLPPSLAERLTVISRPESAELCAWLAQRALAVDIRTAALDRVTDTDVLCAVAVEDAVASVRQAALDRITDPAGWKIVSRNARNKDKKISRAARERLDSHLQTIADREAAEHLCDEMDTLLASDNLTSHSPALYQRLCKQWQEIGSSVSPQLGDRFSQAKQQLAVRINRFEIQIRERRAICTELESLLERIQQALTDPTSENEDLTSQITALDERWQSTAPEQTTDNPVVQRFYELQTQIRQASEELLQDRKRTAKQRELINHASELLEQGVVGEENHIKQLQERWQKLDKPVASEVAQALQQEFDGKLRSMREQLKHGVEQRKKALQQAEKLLPEMQQALQDGELERGLALRDRINHRLKLAKDYDKQRHRLLHQQLNQMRPKIDELRQWRHWSSDQAREHLLTGIEALHPSSLSADEIAARVRSARKAWQRIDRAEGPAEEALWQRFDKACTSAYEPYQQQRKKQKDVMNQHLSQKKQLCAELTAFEQNTDWGSVDLRDADHYINEARKRWRRIGFVARKQGKKLEKDFQAVLELLDSHLAPERNRELKRRKALIARIEELSCASDLRAASREVKDAQNHWKPTITLPRKEEQALWTRFRQACDAVFDRLRDERTSADEERQINLQRKQAICEQLESLLDQPDTDYREIQKQFSATRDEWNGIRNIPRKQERAIDDRYNAIEARIAERQRQQAKSATKARLRALRQRSQLCARLEHAVLSQTMDESSRQALLAQVSQEWQALPAADMKNVEPLQSRFDLATRALQGDSNARASLSNTLAENLQQRMQLCLQLEVAAGVESPAEYADDRMKYQVSLLADSLQHRLPDTAGTEDKITKLETAWLLAGPVEQVEADKLEARFERALGSTG